MSNRKAMALSLLLCGTMAAGLAGCGSSIDGSAAAITVNDEAVSVGTANMMLRASEAQTEYYMASWGMSSGSLWDQEIGSDEEATSDEAATADEAKTYGDSFKDDILDTVEEYVIVRQHAGDYDVTLTDEEESNMAEVAESTYEKNQEAFDQQGISADNVKEVLELYTYRTKMFDVMVADTDTEVSDEEAQQHKITYAKLAIPQTDDDGNEIEATDELKAAYLEDCERVLGEIQAVGDDANVDFNEYADDSNSEYTYLCTSYTYGDGNETMPEEVQTAAAGLSDGEIYDGVIQADDGYYLIRMDAQLDRDSTDAEKETIVSERQQETYDDLVSEWKDASTIVVENGWKNLKVTDSNTFTMQEETTEDTTETTTEEVTADEVVSTADEAE